jgi:hypothetical protein
MDLLLAPDFSSSTASPPSRIPIVLIAHKNGSLIAAQKKFLDKFSGLHLQRISYLARNCRKNCKKTNFPS